MHTLCILRHATAAQADSDAARPLTSAGVAEARQVGAALRAASFRPDLVLCSDARRACETWSAVEAAGGFAVATDDVCRESRLYLASADQLLDRLTEVEDRATQVLLVAHNPGLADLVARLATDSSPLSRGFPPAAFALFDAPVPVRQLGGAVRCQLRQLRLPDRF